MSQRDNKTERTCIVGRIIRSSDDLIRFVLDPSGHVVPDLKCNLPGRGVWVTAQRTYIEAAVNKKLFSKSFKKTVSVSHILPDSIERLLSERALGALSLANKAGLIVTGFQKVDKLLRQKKPVVLLHAYDAGADGKRKLNQLADARWDKNDPYRVDRYLGEQLDVAFGQKNVVHAVLKKGSASIPFLFWEKRIMKYLAVQPADNNPRDQRADSVSAGQIIP